jgi:hypothetical protein
MTPIEIVFTILPLEADLLDEALVCDNVSYRFNMSKPASW